LIALTICIPTYNRREKLERLLASLLPQLDDLPEGMTAEIFVGDNGSEDGTAAMLRELASSRPCIRYYRNETNRGFPYNLNRLVDEARGEYCWLLGSDDVARKGSLAAVFRSLESGPDIALFDVFSFARLRKLHSPPAERIYDIRGIGDLRTFVDECTEVSGLFAFISAIVVRTAFWKAVELDDGERDHPYTHVFRLWRGIAGRGATVKYSVVPIVDTGFSANEYSASLGGNFLLDTLTFVLLADAVHADESVVASLWGLFGRQYSKPYFRRLKWRFGAKAWKEYAARFPEDIAFEYDWGYSFLDALCHLWYPLARSAYVALRGIRVRRAGGIR
jgi:abequosyltransferase